MLRADMPQRRRAGAGRYSLHRAVWNIREAMERFGVSQKQIALTLGITESQCSQKLKMIRNSFTPEELGRVADYFSEVTERPLYGWPWYDIAHVEAIDRAMGWKSAPHQ